MSKQFLSLIAIVAIFSTGCGKLGKSKSKGLKNDGQLYGVAPGPVSNLSKPPGMVYVPPATFH